MDERHWLFWDGECGFCRKALAWFLRRDTAGKFRAVPYQEAPSPPMTPELYNQSGRAVQVLTAGGNHYQAGRAVVFCLEEVGWHPHLMGLARHRPFIWLVEAGYWFVARNRNRLYRFLPDE